MSKEWNSSEVMREFEKIASESNLISTDFENKDYVGNAKADVEVEARYEPSEEYNTKEEGKDILEKAHPESYTAAPSVGKGGLVEDLIEQQEKDIEVALKMPNGVLIGVHAELIEKLVKIANKLEDDGKSKQAKRIDMSIQKINSDIEKTAFILPVVMTLLSVFGPQIANMIFTTKEKDMAEITRKPIGGVSESTVGVAGKATSAVAIGIAAMMAIGQKLTSIKEGLNTDLQDLQDVLLKADESKTAQKASELIRPFLGVFGVLNLQDVQSTKDFTLNVEKLKNNVIPELDKLIAGAVVELQSKKGLFERAKEIFNIDIISSIQEKYKDVKEELKETSDLLQKAAITGSELDKHATDQEEVKESTSKDIEDLQKILFDRGALGKKWDGKVTGEMDENTIKAATELEQALSDKLKEKGMKFEKQIVKDDKLAMEVSKLNRAIEIIETIK